MNFMGREKFAKFLENLIITIIIIIIIIIIITIMILLLSRKLYFQI